MQWRFDGAHTSVEASAKHMMLTTVRVRFPGASGEIELDPDRPESAGVRLSIPVATLASGDERRDAHLRSADFFDGAAHPNITFTSTDVRRIRDEVFGVRGDLTIRGATRPVEVEVALQGILDDPMGKAPKRAFLEARTRIDRREWGLVWNMPVPQGVLVSHEIAIDVAAQLTSEAAIEQAA